MPKIRNPNGPYWRMLADAERQIIINALTATGGDVKRAAGALDINRNYLRMRCNVLEVDVDALRSGNIGRPPAPQAPPAPPPSTEPGTSWLTMEDK